MARHRLGARDQHRHALGRPGSRRWSRRHAPRTRAASRSCSTRSASARPRIAPTRRGASSTRSTSPSCAATGRGRDARRRRGGGARRRVDGDGRRAGRLARAAARQFGLVASVTGPIDHVSDGERVLAIANGHRAARDRDRHGLHLDRAHRLLRRREAGRPARGRGRGARRVRRRRRGRRAPARRARELSTRGSTTRCTALDPDDARRPRAHRRA